jgi:low affinity Fe/Cu permease
VLSRSLERIDRLLASSFSAGIVGAAAVITCVAFAFAGFPDHWGMAFSVVLSAITAVMVFELHHTQRREQIATQLKLDELIRALPQADDHFVQVQAAADDEVRELEQRHRQHYRATRTG